MEVVGVEESPCVQHTAHGTLNPATLHGSSAHTATIFCASSSLCCDTANLSAFSFPRATARPPWLSVAVTADADIVVQMDTPDCGSDDADTFAAHLAAMHGVTVKKSSRAFARLSCRNAQECLSAHSAVLAFPLCAADVLAADVSSYSRVVVHAEADASPAEAPPVEVQSPAVVVNAPQAVPQPRATPSRGCCSLGSVVPKRRSTSRHTASPGDGGGGSAQRQRMIADTTNAAPPLLQSPRKEKESRSKSGHAKASRSKDAAAAVASALPTLALLLRSASPLGVQHVLLLLRPAIRLSHHKYVLEYCASIQVVSCALSRVALRPDGSGVFALPASFSELAFTEGDSDEPAGRAASLARTYQHVVLRGSYAEVAHTHRNSLQMSTLVLHVGLGGSSSSRRRRLRAMLRCRVSGVWCRHATAAVRRAHPQAPAAAALAAAVEVTMYTTEGQVLVFQPLSAPPLSPPAPSDVAAATSPAPHDAPSSKDAMTVYTCSYGARLSHTALCEGNPAPAAVAPSSSLLVAPPWRFVDQWCHSGWFRRALEGKQDMGGAAGELPAHRRRSGPHRHAPSSVLATSANRRVWLVHAGSSLSIVTVPSGFDGESSSASTPSTTGCGEERKVISSLASTSCSYGVYRVSAQETLHDVQFVQADGHAGFLLLCRRRTAAEANNGDADRGCVWMNAATDRGNELYVHAKLSSPLRVVFLSLLALPDASSFLHGGGDGGAVAGYTLPLHCGASFQSRLSSLVAAPSYRLRFVCAASPAHANSLATSDVVYVCLASSAEAHTVLAATVRLPSLTTWCSHGVAPALCRPSCQEVAGAWTWSVPLSTTVQRCVTHALSAALPSALIAGETKFVDAGWTDLLSSSADCSMETAVEVALLKVHDGYHSSSSSNNYRTQYAEYARSVQPFTDVLTCILDSFTGVLLNSCADAGNGAETTASLASGQAVACVTAVFAGFSAALRMSGLVGASSRYAECTSNVNHNNEGARSASKEQRQQQPAGVGLLVLLHSSVQVLTSALQRLCVGGHVSALLACVSHLTQTVRPHAFSPNELTPTSQKKIAVCTPRVLWQLLLQPLFDFVWCVLQDYGMTADVTGDVLLYCSPALRAVSTSGRLWCGGSVKPNTTDNSTRPLAIAAAAGAAPPHAPQPSPASAEQREEVIDVPSAPAVAAPTAPSPSLATIATYSSAELYELVSRVFLLHGAAAALKLVQELQQHDGAQKGVAEMAQTYEAMQRRLALLVS